MAHRGKFVDRSPCIPPAGVTTPIETQPVSSCLVHDISENEVRNVNWKINVLDYNVPALKSKNYKGWFSNVRECMQPDTYVGFGDVLTREFQDTAYESYWKKPLGRIADRATTIPVGMDPEKVRFGKPTPKDIAVGVLIHPPKSYTEVMEESRVGHEMFRETLKDYDPGEEIQRRYVKPFDRDLVWGMNTPCEPRGGCMKKMMVVDRKDYVFASEILPDYRKRFRPIIGKGLAPNNNIERVPEGHAFGKLYKRQLYGAGKSLEYSHASLEKVELYEQLSHINVLRQQIAKKLPSFPHRDLIHSFHQYDIRNTGWLPLDIAYKTLSEFQIFPDKQLFQNLLTKLKYLSKEKIVAYEKMADLLNVNALFPDLNKIKDVPTKFLNFETTSKVAHKYHCSDEFMCKDPPMAGLTAKYQVPIKFLMNPMNFGLEPKDFFVAKSPEYLRTLFGRVAGCDMDDDFFTMIWNAAKDDNGCVCVESFYNALKMYT